jgi:hypothetical protein
MNLPMDPMDQELNGGMGKALPDSVYNDVGVVKNFFNFFKHTPTFASRKRRQGRSDRFCRTVHRQTLDAADDSLQSRPDEAKLRPYPGFLCGV